MCTRVLFNDRKVAIVVGRAPMLASSMGEARSSLHRIFIREE